MRRTVQLFVVMAVVVAACSGSDDTAQTSTSAAPTTSVATPDPATTTTTPADVEPVEWNPDVAEELLALEAANEGQWTIDTALDAVRILRPVFLEGIETEAPINITRLVLFIAENYDDVPQDEWEAVVAAGPVPNAQLASFQSEEIRRVYQDIAVQADGDFERLTGHALNVPIYVALSDLELPFDVYAGTWVGGGDASLEGFTFMFGSEDAWQQMADGVNGLVATTGEACVIVLGQALTRWNANRQVSGLFHEVVHCHQNQVHPLGRAGFTAVDVDWMDEGYASWAGEAFLGGTLNSRLWWSRYLNGGVGSPPDGFSLFEGAYRSLGFYSMLATAGVDPWAEFVPWFNGLRANGVSNVARYNGMTSGANPEVVAGWAASASRNDDFGPPWNSDNGPGIQNSRVVRRPNNARAGGEPRPFTAGPGEQRYWAVQFNTAVDQPSLITIEAEGLGTYRWVHDAWKEQFVVTDSFSTSWCVGEDCVCEDGTSPAPGALLAPIVEGDRPVLHSALFGGDGQAKLTASVEPLEDACEEEEAEGPLDACLFGTWNPDPDQYQDFLLTLYRTLPISLLTLEGTLDLTFTEDGAFSQAYNGTKGSGVIGGETYEAQFLGASFGTWEAAGGVVTLTFTGSDISAIVNGIPAVAPPIPTATVEAGYTCGASDLVVDPPPGTPGPLFPLPTDWSKVG